MEHMMGKNSKIIFLQKNMISGFWSYTPDHRRHMSVPCRDIFLKKDFARDAVCSLHCIDSIFHLAEKERKKMTELLVYYFW